MTTHSFWIIQHAPSGATLPFAHGRMGRGGSFVEPTSELPPRLFNSERAAKGFLTSWLKGQVHSWHNVSYEGEHDCGIDIVPVPSRTRAEMRIIKRSIRV